MKKNPNLLALAAATTLALAAGHAGAESTYGYATAAGAGVSTSARVNLSVTVPKMILLRIGTTPAAPTDLAWTAALSVASAPVTPAVGDNQAATWTGATAPSSTLTANPTAVPVTVWTNNFGGGSLSYTATPFTAVGGGVGPTLASIGVTATGALGHPGTATLAATSGAGPVAFAALGLINGSWSYTLGGTASSWNAGVYTATVTYTAASV